MTDAESSATDSLVRRASAGDEAARAQLLDRHRSRLRRMVAIRLDKRVAARVDPSDVVQDALRDAHRRLPEYLADPQVAFYPWLRRIASDRLEDVHRTHIAAERRSVLNELPWAPNLNDESVVELAQHLVTSSIQPHERLAQAEMQARVQAALQDLNPPDREILVLRYLEQLGVAEIAGVLGVSQTAVTSRHLRALRRLRRLLGDEHGS